MTSLDEWQPGRLLANICRLHATRSDQLMDQIGLYRGQAILLLILSSQDGRTHTEIAQELHISPAATTKIIQRLEKMAYLQRRSDPFDERVSRVYLLKDGQAVIQQIKDSVPQAGPGDNDQFYQRGTGQLERSVNQAFYQSARGLIRQNEIIWLSEAVRKASKGTRRRKSLLKKLSVYVGLYKKYLIYIPILVLLDVLCELSLPLLMGKVIDVGIAGADIQYIVQIGLLMILLALAAMGFGILNMLFNTRASMGFGANLRDALFEKVQAFSFTNIDQFSTASLITRLTNDVNNLQLTFMMALRILLRAPMMLIIAFILAYNINAELSIVLAVAIPLLAVGVLVIMKTAVKRFSDRAGKDRRHQQHPAGKPDRHPGGQVLCAGRFRNPKIQTLE